MLASEAEFTVIDFESTGSVEDYPNEAWQIGLVKMSRGRISDQLWERYLKVGDRPFNPKAPGKHHQLRDVLATAPTLLECWDEWNTWCFGPVLVAHNIGTEQKFIRDTAPMHKAGPWVDTLKLARVVYPEFHSHKLEDLCEGLGLTPALKERFPDREPHDALYDAMASAFLLEHFLSLAGWESVTVDMLVKAKPISYYKVREVKRKPYR